MEQMHEKVFFALRHTPRYSPREFGLLLVASGTLLFSFFVYAAIISKLLPYSGYAVLDAIRDDWYYCLLVPLTVPVIIVAVYCHWLSMKLFKHA
ncbi:hypothetical protein O6H91_08G087900 [Diphasiastrum complanatum]|uniref:Uncharacterized protein n=1 Tax=Diphasiastrum complanatum TaxID=34168 RepID=A0ACC2CZU8_DIPCM|nr:hypothetical protein O6H91_08G087900 [Diphasiastrum complanatum]